MGGRSDVNNWPIIRSKMGEIVDNWFTLQHSSTNAIRELLMFNLGLRNAIIPHPIYGELKLKIRGRKTKHFNISLSKSINFEQDWTSKKLLQVFGYADKQGHRYALRRRIKTIQDDNESELGLKFNSNKIELWGNSIMIGTWDFSNIVSRFESKSKTLVFDYQYDEDLQTVMFTNPKIVLLNRSHLETNFSEMIEKGHISPEFRMFMGESHTHCLERKISPNSVKDYGFGWRLKASENNEIYITRDLEIQ